MVLSPIQVSETPAQVSARVGREKIGKPSHWVHSVPAEFQNPWPSWRKGADVEDFLEITSTSFKVMKPPSNEAIAGIPVQKPSWGVDERLMAENAHKIKATWLGHACFLVELPSPIVGVRGPRILFDPVFSDRCGPRPWLGPKRFISPPCALEDVPEVDAIVISHNHYDHMDTPSLRNLLARNHAPHVFAPLGNSEYFHNLGVPSARTHCLDWWDGRRVSVPVSATQTVEFDVTFTPGQHFTGRGIFDRFKSLWGGWVVEAVSSLPSAADPSPSPACVYFGGDTGYRSVPSSADEGPDSLPVCPAFKEIGARWGAFDLALIPIGAYAPRRFMSPVHCAPRDSVAIFRDIKARRGLGMHWGAWMLTTEDILEPPALLATECARAGIKEGAFGVCAVGETVSVDVGESR
ncbi:N-acyl-phosphatidylethanolamine-hydrolyzing phospholipase D [Mycena crocata]|nr:N-acyl-phosphatidylethanolamine-hydrolyzing phospholipase D [Mycena crocata]